ncbi:RNA polymerase sigma-70 factor [Bacteroides sp. 519]|uniref:RNA polymerase sigma-70 factor n=1 Tax=Bacteroides sp. 519 TaxID=2302937 RepID=UPI0013D5C8A0|nr:RNA polymerase sigma-70 factor [Bacteroides sp. 519]NDV57159.1 RNA polymerase sigma-70 factor [Bacteroides sp. 519]
MSITKQKVMYNAFENLFLEYFEPLVTYAYRYLNDWQIAEDIVQDTFLSLWTNKEQVDFSISVKPYLYRAVYNKSINHIQQAYNQRRVSSEDTDSLINRIIMEFNQYDTLLAKEVDMKIDRFVETLPPQCKNVFILSRKKHLKNKEIAETLGISEKAVEKHISKALLEIRQHLRKLDLLILLMAYFLHK